MSTSTQISTTRSFDLKTLYLLLAIAGSLVPFRDRLLGLSSVGSFPIAFRLGDLSSTLSILKPSCLRLHPRLTKSNRIFTDREKQAIFKKFNLL